MTALAVESLHKNFGTTAVLKSISFEVGAGEIYGFLGLNGAGKTTLIRILLGMIWADSGKVTLLGETLSSRFSRWNAIGYLVETPCAYPDLSVYENLKVFFHLRRLDRLAVIDEIIDRLKLRSFAKTKARHLSLGNQQRLGLAKALMHRPRLLILDEPINGLDPEGIAETRELMQELAREGCTIFLSSHILGEMSKVAGRFAIIHQGNLVREESSKSLAQAIHKKLLVKTADNHAALRLLTGQGFSGQIRPVDHPMNEIELTDPRAILHPEMVAECLVKNGLPPSKLFLQVEDLESYFLGTIRSPA